MSGHHPQSPISRSAPTLRSVVEAGHDGDSAVVERGLAASDPQVRAAALAAKVRLGTLAAAELGRFLTDPDPGVRRKAAELAPRIPEAAATELPLGDRLDDDPTVAEMAAFALGEVGSADGVEPAPSTIAALSRAATDHTDALVREAAVAALGALHSGLDAILVATGDKATVRRRAIIALAPFDGPEVQTALAAALDDRDWQVRQAAEDLLAISDESDPS